jgi:hypothetical protein
MSNGTSPAIDCANCEELTATAATIVGPDRTKTVTATIDRHLISAQHRTISSVPMCSARPTRSRPGRGASLHSLDTNGDAAADFYYALLPACGTAPRVAKRKQNEECDVVIVTKAPGGSQDPAYRP